MVMKKILIVVDYQYDFYHPEGALYVPGGEKLQEKIEKIIPDFDGVIFTQDYHPVNHCSFKENGGIWPAHCVMDSVGCGIPLSMLQLAKNHYIEPKGLWPNEEEYGAFSNPDKLRINLISIDKSYRNINDYQYVICGLVDSYCVVETMKNIVRHTSAENVLIFRDGIGSLGNPKAFEDFVKENNIQEYGN